MSAIFHHNEHHESCANETRETRSRRTQRTIYTEIKPISKFYLAEGYHQKYNLRQYPVLMKAYISIYPDEEDFINSTSAARVNGYVSGYGTVRGFKNDANSLGLSPSANNKVTDIISSFRGDK